MSALVRVDSDRTVGGLRLGLSDEVLCRSWHAESCPGASSEQTVGMLKEHVRKVIGPIASPDRIRVVSGLPKTRSGKIMRRILRKVAEGHTEDLGDTSTLADPAVVDELLKPAPH